MRINPPKTNANPTLNKELFLVMPWSFSTADEMIMLHFQHWMFRSTQGPANVRIHSKHFEQQYVTKSCACIIAAQQANQISPKRFAD
jgi:hypothetical protein